MDIVKAKLGSSLMKSEDLRNCMKRMRDCMKRLMDDGGRGSCQKSVDQLTLPITEQFLHREIIKCLAVSTLIA